MAPHHCQLGGMRLSKAGGEIVPEKEGGGGRVQKEKDNENL